MAYDKKDAEGVSKYRNNSTFKKGHKHSDEVKEKIKRTLTGRKSSEETKKKISESNKGKHRMSEAAKKKLREDVVRKRKISASLLKLWEEERIEIKSKNHYKSCYYDSMVQGKVFLRSSSELKFATFLDLMSGFGSYFVWLYEVERFPIRDDKGKTKNVYCPDFWILPEFSLKKVEELFGTTTLNKVQVKKLLSLCKVKHIIDIKGWYNKKHPSYEKIKEFKLQYPNEIFDIVVDKQKSLREDSYVNEILIQSLERIGISNKKYGDSYILADMPKEIQEEIYDVFGWFLMSTSRLLRSFKDKIISIDNIFWDQFLNYQSEKHLKFLMKKTEEELLKRYPNKSIEEIVKLIN